MSQIGSRLTDKHTFRLEFFSPASAGWVATCGEWRVGAEKEWGKVDLWSPEQSTIQFLFAQDRARSAGAARLPPTRRTGAGTAPPLGILAKLGTGSGSLPQSRRRGLVQEAAGTVGEFGREVLAYCYRTSEKVILKAKQVFPPSHNVIRFSALVQCRREVREFCAKKLATVRSYPTPDNLGHPSWN